MPDFDPSMELEDGKGEEEEFPGNWLTICLTKEEVAAAMETEDEEAEGEMARFFEERLCCFGRVGGG